MRCFFLRVARSHWRPLKMRQSPFTKSILLVTLCFCVVAFGVSWVPKLTPPKAVPAFAPAGDGQGTSQGWLANILERYSIDFTAVLNQGLPLAPLRGQVPGEAAWLQRPDLLARGASSLRSLRLPLGSKPLDFLASELALFRPSKASDAVRSPVLEEPPEESPVPEQAGTVQEPQEPAKPVQAPIGPPLVAVYHTHTSEDYVPSSGSSHTYEKKAGIVVVGETLVRALAEEHGIRAVHDITVHDNEKFREAYLRSADTAARLCRDNPSLKMILDVHRDAPSINTTESRAMTTVEINGQKVARLYLIVGSDRLGLAHPNWQQNHAFALKLQQKLEALYPGLSRGIKIDTARFNQHLHPRALLVEVGGDQNTLAEAELAAKYLAEAIVAILPELD